MDRRAVLSTLAVALCGCLSDPPGPTGPRNPPDEPPNDPRSTPTPDVLSVTTFDFEETEDGSLRVFGAVENAGDVERTAQVRVRVTAEGSRTERTTEVAVPAGDEARFEVVFQVRYQAFVKNGSIDVNLV